MAYNFYMKCLRRITSMFILITFSILPFINSNEVIDFKCKYIENTSIYLNVCTVIEHGDYVPFIEPVEYEEVEIETGDIFVEEDPIINDIIEIDPTPLNYWIGVNYYNGFKETYYNLPMQGVCNILEHESINGYYWVRDDGCKMWGEYIMVGASFELFNRGDIVTTSLGKAMVCDTGTFAYENMYQFDIATTW